MWLGELQLGESTSHTPLGDRQASLSGVECGYLRHRRTIPLMHTVTYLVFKCTNVHHTYGGPMRCGSASFSSSNPLRIPRPKIDKLAYQAQGVGILATGEIFLCSIMQSCIFLSFACVLFSRSVIISQKNAFVKSLRLIFSVFVFYRFVPFNFLPIE